MARQRAKLRPGCAVIGFGCALIIVALVVWVHHLGRLPGRAAQKATCLANILHLAKAMRLYANDHGGLMFFDRNDAFSRPLVAGHYGQTRYLRWAMKEYVPSGDVWYCPSDEYRKRDFTCSAATSGSFNYQESGPGYVAIPHEADSDPGIRALRSALLEDYGADQMQVDHAWSSYRFYPIVSPGCETAPTQIDTVKRCFRDNWGAYGYWDINPSVVCLFEEDLPFHVPGPRGPYGKPIYGKSRGYRDTHAFFCIYGDEATAMVTYGGDFLMTKTSTPSATSPTRTKALPAAGR